MVEDEGMGGVICSYGPGLCHGPQESWIWFLLTTEKGLGIQKDFWVIRVPLQEVVVLFTSPW